MIGVSRVGLFATKPTFRRPEPVRPSSTPCFAAKLCAGNTDARQNPSPERPTKIPSDTRMKRMISWGCRAPEAHHERTSRPTSGRERAPPTYTPTISQSHPASLQTAPPGHHLAMGDTVGPKIWSTLASRGQHWPQTLFVFGTIFRKSSEKLAEATQLEATIKSDTATGTESD